MTVHTADTRSIRDVDLLLDKSCESIKRCANLLFTLTIAKLVLVFSSHALRMVVEITVSPIVAGGKSKGKLVHLIINERRSLLAIFVR